MLDPNYLYLALEFLVSTTYLAGTGILLSALPFEA